MSTMSEREREEERLKSEYGYRTQDMACCLNCKHSGGVCTCLTCYEGSPAKMHYPVEWNGICDKYELGEP